MFKAVAVPRTAGLSPPSVSVQAIGAMETLDEEGGDTIAGALDSCTLTLLVCAAADDCTGGPAGTHRQHVPPHPPPQAVPSHCNAYPGRQGGAT